MQELNLYAEATRGSNDMADTNPSLDPEILDDLRQIDETGDGSFLTELIDTYLGTSARSLPQLSAAISESDTVATRDTAHSLRSCSCSVGAMRLAQLYQQLEMLGQSGDLGGAYELLEEVHDEFLLVASALSKQRRTN